MSTRDTGLNRALEQVGTNILEAFIQKAQIDFQNQQLAQQKELELGRQALEKEKFSEEKRVQAFNRIATIAPLLKPGSRVMDNEMVHDDFAMVFPGADPKDPEGLGGVVITPESWENTFVPQMLAEVRGMSPQAQKDLYERSAFKLATGENMTSQEAALRQDVLSWQAKSVADLGADPKFMEDVGRRAFGLESRPQIRLDGKLVTYNSATEAQLAVEIWKQRGLLAFYRESLAADKQGKGVDLVGEFMQQVSDGSEKKVQISRPLATRIMTTVHEPFDPAKPEEVQAHLARIDELRKISPQMDYAVGVYTRAAALQEEFGLSVLQQYPGLEEYVNSANYLISKGLPPTAVGEIMPGLARQLQNRGAAIAAPRRFTFGGLRDPWTGVGVQRAPGTETTATGTTTGTGETGPTLNNLEAVMNRDAEEFNAGRMSWSQLDKKWGRQGAAAIRQQASILKKGKK